MEEKIEELIKENEVLRDIIAEQEQNHKKHLQLEEYRWGLGCFIGVFLAYLTIDLSVLTDFYAVGYSQVVFTLLFKVMKAFFVSAGCLACSSLFKILFDGLKFKFTKKQILLLLIGLIILFFVAATTIFLKVS